MDVAAKAIDRPGLMRRAAILSLSVSVLLVAIKLIAYLVTHSVSVLASFADSALDLFTSTLNLIAIRSALRPADAEHRFGHGKAEPLAGLAQGAFIAGSATFLVIQAINRFLEPQAVESGSIALLVMLISLAGSVAWLAWQAAQPGLRRELKRLACGLLRNSSAVAGWHLAQVPAMRLECAVDSGSLTARML